MIIRDFSVGWIAVVTAVQMQLVFVRLAWAFGWRVTVYRVSSLSPFVL